MPGAAVGGHIGYVDMTQGVSAFRRENGEHLVFVEDQDHARAVLFRGDMKF